MRPDRASKLREFYSSSETYLERLTTHGRQMFTQYVDCIRNAVPEGGFILDCGAGTGLSSCYLAECGFRVTSLDLSPLFVLEGARRHKTSKTTLSYCVGDAARMPFDDESFDAVCSFHFLEHVVKVRDTLAEMSRVTKRGGACIIFMPNHLDPLQHIWWQRKSVYKPWESSTRMGSLRQAWKMSLLAVAKALGLNKRIYYLEPVLSDDKERCGQDYDATWLSNWFDIESNLQKNGFRIQPVDERMYNDRVLHLMRSVRLPKTIEHSYIRVRKLCRIIARKE